MYLEYVKLVQSKGLKYLHFDHPIKVQNTVFYSMHFGTYSHAKLVCHKMLPNEKRI